MSIASIATWSRRLALFLSQVILVLVFGCGPAPTEVVISLATATGSTSPTGSPVPVIATPPAQSTETQVPALTATPFVPKAVIKIFSHVPLSVSRESQGQDILRGTELAVQQLAGPLNEFGYKVELVAYDDQNLVQTALANAQAIVADPEILCGVGHYDSDTTIAASDTYHAAGLAFVTPAATAPLLTDRNYLEVNRLIGRADGQGFAAAQFAREQGIKSIFVVSQKGDNTLRNAEFFRTETSRLGIQWLGSELNTVNDENRAKVVSEIVNANPELLYISTSANQAIPLLTALRAAGYRGRFLGTERLDNPSVISAAGMSLVQDGGLYYTLTSAPAEYYPSAAQFVQDFQSRYSAPPLSFAARAYDATGICLKAIENATRARGGTLPSRGEVARAIRALKDYQGVTGTHNFNSRGEATPIQYYVYQVISTESASWDQNPVVAAYEVTPP